MLTLRTTLISIFLFIFLVSIKAPLVFGQKSGPFGEEIKSPSKKRRSPVVTDQDHNHSIGIGFSVPEVLPVEYNYRISSNFSWHSFFVIPLPFNIRVELPRDTVSKKEVVIDQPALNIKLKAVYGPQVGTGVRWYPFHNGFYSRFGVAYRRLRLAGKVQSPIIIIVDDFETTTSTEFGIKVNAVTESLLARFEFGWRWNFGQTGYIDWVIAGVALPSTTTNAADVVTYVDAPGDNDDIGGALEVLKNEKEMELRDKALSEMKPATQKILPIIGVTLGYRF